MTTTTDTRLYDLVINVLNKRQLKSATLQDNQIYLTPDDDVEEFVPPSDWIDIRSGALDNSIYLLVAHSAPTESGGTYTVATYPQLEIRFTLSTSANTYDVFVDGNKVFTQTHNTWTTLNWGELYTSGKVSTVHTTTHPTSLVYHVLRFTPTVSTDTLTGIVVKKSSSEVSEQGILWAHFQISNPIRIVGAFANDGGPYNRLMEAVTAKNDKITYIVDSSLGNSGIHCTFLNCSSLVKIPVLEANSADYPSSTYRSFGGVSVKKVIIKNNNGTELSSILNNTDVQEFDIENGLSFACNTAVLNSANSPKKLKRFPNISGKGNSSNIHSIQVTNAVSLEPTVIDDSTFKTRTLFRFCGDNSSNFVSGLKGVIVSNEAPFDGASPQINVSYTGLDRAALVNLFKSMPYNVGYTVVGSPTITSGVASGFSNANYLNLPSISFAGNDFEAVINYSYPENATTFRLGLMGSFGSTKWQAFCGGTGAFRFYAGGTQYFPQLNSKNYTYIKIVKTGNSLSVSQSNDGVIWVNQEDFTNLSWTADSVNNQIGIGGPSDTVEASVNLNNSYIKINGVPWFTGKAAMTKTCSIVGCTGTADLTADDKAIATDKGWALTLS